MYTASQLNAYQCSYNNVSSKQSHTGNPFHVVSTNGHFNHDCKCYENSKTNPFKIAASVHEDVMLFQHNIHLFRIIRH